MVFNSIKIGFWEGYEQLSLLVMYLIVFLYFVFGMYKCSIYYKKDKYKSFIYYISNFGR